MNTEIEQCLNRLETAVTSFEKSSLKTKNIDRPMFDNGNQKNKDLNQFVKYGEKSLSSNDGRGNLVLRKPQVSEITRNTTTPTMFREIAGQTITQTDNFEMVIECGNTDAGWAQESNLNDPTNLSDLKKLNITTHEMYARVQISQRLLDDSEVDLENWLMDSIQDKFSTLEEDAFINGDGINKPMGFLSYGRAHKAEWGKFEDFKTGKNGSFLNADVLINTVSSLKTPYLNKAVWLMSRSAFAQIKNLKEESTGRHLWQPNFQDGHINMLLGFPVILSDAMPNLICDKSSTSIAFGNFTKGYQIIDRKEINVLRDPYSAKPFVEFFVTQRIGGDVIDFESIKTITASE